MTAQNATTGNLIVKAQAAHMVSIGANGFSISFGKFSVIFGSDNGTNKMELKAVNSSNQEIGLRLDETNGLSVNTGGTKWYNFNSSALREIPS